MNVLAQASAHKQALVGCVLCLKVLDHSHLVSPLLLDNIKQFSKVNVIIYIPPRSCVIRIIAHSYQHLILSPRHVNIFKVQRWVLISHFGYNLNSSYFQCGWIYFNTVISSLLALFFFLRCLFRFYANFPIRLSFIINM